MEPAVDKKRYAGLSLQRRWYADEVRWNAKLQSELLAKAFATVPREAFLGRGPWHILGETQLAQGLRGYTRTSDADPRHLNHNVLVAIDAKRGLNNGHPSFLASLIDQLNLKDGETAYHVGCGTGYYSAIIAEMVGKGGRVIAVDVDKTLARRARRNLEGYRHVEVVNADGFAHNPGHVDAILVNAGVTHLSQVWLRELRAKGRLVVPLTTKKGGQNSQGNTDQTKLACAIYFTRGDLSLCWGEEQVCRKPPKGSLYQRRCRKGSLIAVRRARTQSRLLVTWPRLLFVATSVMTELACRDEERKRHEIGRLPHNPLLPRTGHQRSASSTIIVARRRTRRWEPRTERWTRLRR